MPESGNLQGKGVAIIPPLATALRARCEARPSQPGVDIAIDLAVTIANADGSIDESEMEALSKTLYALIGEGLTPEQVQLEISSSLQTIRAQGTLSYGQALGGSLASLGAGEEGLRLAAAIAYASRGLNPEERVVLEAIAQAASIPGEVLERILREVQSAFEAE